MNTRQRRAIRQFLLPIALASCVVSCGGPSSSGTKTSPASSASSGSASEEDDDVSASAKAAVAAHMSASASSATPPHTPGTPIALDGLFDKTAPKAEFPKKSATDKDCYRTVGISGKSDKDYEALVAACGAPTGMKEFTKRVTGKLDAKNPRDTYVVKMRGGLCYRFYAVGDGQMGNLDIRVQKPSVALVSMDQSKQAIAILDPDEPWCKTHDREFHFVVESNGPGGAYVFGVWARPK